MSLFSAHPSKCEDCGTLFYRKGSSYTCPACAARLASVNVLPEPPRTAKQALADMMFFNPVKPDAADIYERTNTSRHIEITARMKR